MERLVNNRPQPRWFITFSFLLAISIGLSPPPPAGAADVITDGDMEQAGIANWPHTDLTGTNSSAKATDQSASGQSLKGTSQTGKKINVEWYNAQNVGLINSTDVVRLSLWWGGQFSHVGGGNFTTLSFDVKPASGSWGTAWSTTLNAGSTSFQTGTVTDLDVSASFGTTESYDVRLRLTGTTGNNDAAMVYAWWDDVVLDVTTPAPVTTVGNGTNPAGANRCPGDGAAELDAFTLQTSSGTDTVSAVQVTLAAGTAGGLSLVEITDDGGLTVYGSVANPASDVVDVALGTNINVTTTSTQYKVRITPKTHAAMPAPPGSSYAVTGTVTAITCTNDKVYNDAGSATVTIDNQSPADATWGTVTPGDGQVVLNWTNPGDADFAEVVILRSTASISDAPTEGASYVQGNTIGSSEVRYVGSLETFTDLTVVNGTDYWYKIFAKDGCGNYALGAETGPHQPNVPPSTTVGNGTDPGNATICPDAGGTELDAFTLQTSAGTDTVTAVEVTLAAGTAARLGLVEITSDDGATVYGSVTDPAADVVNVSLSSSITATTTLTQYKVRLTPKGHAAMPAPPGAAYGVTGTVTAITSTNSKTYGDSASATVTIDNQSPGDATWGTITPGDGQIVLNWTNPGDGDFAEVVILRSTASISDAPTEGTSYVQGNTIGSSEVRYVGSLETFTDSTVVNGTDYWYKIFAKDNCGNYATGAETGPHTPAPGGVNEVTTGAPSAVVDGCTQITVNAPYSDDDNNNSTTDFEQGPTATGPWTPVCSGIGGASPRSCVDNTVAESSTYYYQVTFADGDGVNGANPQVIGPYATPACTADATTIGANTAVATSCRQITVTSTFSGDGDGDGSVQVEYFDGGWIIACATVTGASPRQCLIPGLSPGTSYDVRVTFSDPDGVAGTNPETIAPTPSTPACGTSDVPPTVMFLAPARNGVIGGNERIKVQVFDDGTISSVRWDFNALTFPVANAAVPNGNYNCGAGCTVYEFDLDVSGESNQGHYLAVRAIDDDGYQTVVTQPIRVYNVGGQAGGDGFLLRRTRGSQICIDCHALPTHSSQMTDAGYGNWAIECLTCHATHATTNIYLISETIDTPYSGTATNVFFRNQTGKADFSYASTTSPGTGLCEVCHTRTSYYDNSGTGGGHYTDPCTDCHGHDGGFAGGACDSCHFSPPTVGRHGSHDQVGSVPASYTATASHGNATQYGFACAKCHTGGHINDGSLGTLGDPYDVEVVFDNSADPKNPSGSYTPAAQSSDLGANGTEYWGWSDGTCSNLYCHSNASPLGGSASYQTVTWNQAAGSLDCTSCHDTGGAASGLSVAHRIHTDAARYNYGCIRCHAATVSDNTTVSDKTYHVNGVKNAVFDASGPDNSGGSYSGSPGYACSNTYCHSDGKDLVAPYTSGPSIAWNTTRTCATCHDDADAAATGLSAAHFMHTETDGYGLGCERCHVTTVSNSTTIATWANHVNAAQEVFFDATGPDNSGGSYDGGGETCSNTYCHSDGKDLVAPYTSGPSIAWTASRTCATCHDAASATATALSAAHFMHTETDGYGLGCERCHVTTASNSTTIANKANHVNAAQEVFFDATGPDNSGGSYDGGGETCSNTYCHSDGKDLVAPYTSGPSIAWTASRTCTSCHDAASATATALSAAHFLHTETDGYALGCERCHVNTVSNSTTIANKANHVNAAQDVFFDASGVNNSGGSYNAGGETCTNTYCHSPGTDLAAPYVSGPSIGWAATRNCYSCHGSSGDGGPDYPNGTPKANSHPAHVASYGCQVCHASVVDATPAIIDKGLHVDGAYNVAAGGGYSFTPSGSPTSCASNVCHGDLTWGDTGMGCRDCHMVSNAGVSDDNEIYNAGTAIIDGNEWSYSGHGSNDVGGYFTNQSGNGAPNLDAGGDDGCLYCHSNPSETINHGVASNPYRLVNSGGGDGKIGVCTVCHGGGGYDPDGGGPLGLDSTLDVDSWHYGSDHATGDAGGTFCWDCHDPHGDSESAGAQLAYMIQRNPVEVHAGDAGPNDWGIPATIPDDLASAPDFRKDRDGTNTWDWGDYVSDTLVGGTYRGVCQVCHDGPVRFLKSSVYDAGHYETSGRCVSCHPHDQANRSNAFSPSGGGGCLACHGGGIGARRAVNADFDDAQVESHHVGNAGTYMGGTLTDEDCVVCHAEGEMSGGSPATTDYHNDAGKVTQLCRNLADTQFVSCIDLKDSDNVGTVYRYNKQKVSESAGAAANWNSGNAEWVTETASNLDPFCLTCHDADGAVEVGNGTIGETPATALNPFNDGTITNEYDQVDRTRVVDVASRVVSSGSDLDQVGEARGPDGIPDPPQGIYARHAIRGQSVSVYSTQAINNSFWNQTQYAWNDTSVMGCADCHTTDGANATAGNAHGSDSEYLLKDASGGATEGTMAGNSYNCYLCHALASYQPTSGHTANSSDYQDYTIEVGAARVPESNSGGNIYAMACTNCHGGAVDTVNDGTGDHEFGTIHGTSQVMDVYGPVGMDTGQIGTRKAYRFMNGNSMRFYQPDTDDASPWNWGGTDIKCYTLSAKDTFGGCTKHSGGTNAFTKPVQRNLSY